MTEAESFAPLAVDAAVKPGTHAALVLGFATHRGGVVAVGGQGRDLFLLADDGWHFRGKRSPGKGLRNAWWNDHGIWVVGEYGYAARSSDGGATWEKIPTGTSGCLFGVVQDSEGVFWIAGDNGYVARATDGGVKFKKVKGVSQSIGRIAATPKGVLIPTDDPGYLYVARGREITKTAIVTEDSQGTCTDLMAATVTPRGTIVTVGNKGVVIRSEDDGATFTHVDIGATGLLAGIDVLADGRVIVVGASGGIYVSSDDAKTFTRLDQHVTTAMLWCVRRTGTGAVVGGTDGVVLRLSLPEAAAERVPLMPSITPGPPPPAPAPTAPNVAAPSATRPEWATPPPSTARQAWPIPAPLPVERRKGVFWTPELRALLHPRRGGADAQVRPVPTIEEAWARLRRGLWAADRAGMEAKSRPSGIWSRVISFSPRERRFGERLLDPAPRVGTPDEDRTLFSEIFAQYSTFVVQFRDEVFEAAADFMVACHGLPEAIRRTLGGLKDELPYSAAGPFGRLRELIAVADDATYAAARDAVLSTLATEKAAKASSHHRIPDLHWAATFMLPVLGADDDAERGLHDAALAWVGEFGNFNVRAMGLASGDLATLERYLTANKRVRHEFFAGEPRRYLASLLDLEGDRVAPALAKMKLSPPFEDSGAENSKWCQLLAHLDHDDALGALFTERAGKGRTWGTQALLTAARFNFDRVASLARARGDDELLRLIEAERGRAPEVPHREIEDSGMAGISAPVPYVPAEPVRPSILSNPLGLEPDVAWRDPELAWEPFLPDLEWDDQKLLGAPDAVVEAFVAHLEKWAIPAEVTAIGATPGRVHPRLFALGFSFNASYWARGIGAIALGHGERAVPLLVATLATPSVQAAGFVAAQGIGDVSLAPPMVAAFAGKRDKALGRSWLLRHPRHAAAGILEMLSADPASLEAMRALRFLDARGHRDTILALAQKLGREDAVRELLDRDPLTAPKVKRPTIPDFVRSAALPPLVRTEAGAAPLEAEAVDRLLTEAAFSNADEVHPGVLAAKRETTEASRAAFAWAVFDAWLAAGADPKHAWCMQLVGFFGDDTSARKLAALAKEWPGQNAAARAQAALDALLNIGTDTALVNINVLAEKSKYPAFKAAAKERIDAIADARGLTSDELADRLVPTLGLDEPGADLLDYGPRQFRIVFDESLAPVLVDAATGRNLGGELPKPAKADDKELAKAAKAKLTGLKKDAKMTASLQVARLERAMRTGRRIAPALFLEAFAAHPWMRHLTRRVVWGVFEGGAGARPEPVTTFRIAEDGSLADADDRAFTLASDALVGVTHPVHLAAEDRRRWSERFAEYELLQPFPQLGRPVYVVSEAERGQKALTRFDGLDATYSALRGLETRGWQRWMDDDAVVFAKPLTGPASSRGARGAYAILATTPGWHPSMTADDIDPQKVESIALHDRHDASLTLGRLDPVTFSELVYDVEMALVARA